MRRAILSSLMLLAAAAAHAAPTTVLKQETVYEVATDGTWTSELTSVVRINEQSAVAGAGQAPLRYSESLQQLEILEAYTTTKDGTRIDVPADKILTQQLPASTGAPTFSDYKVRNVIFPQVEIGATLTLHYRLKQLKPYLPGVFTLRANWPRIIEIEDMSLTLRAPEKMQLYISAQEVQGGSVKSTSPGKREWRWTFSNPTAALPENGAISPMDYGPSVTVSNLKDYPALAAAYMAGAAPTAKVTPAVQQLADEITAGITDKRAQAEAIYRWVGSKIRYVAIAIGNGGYVPHTADEVIDARYGDCKDKTTLLTALLNAKGIRATAVLVNASNSYTLPEQPVLSAFDHAITYLPDFNLFVDSTSGFAPFGTLSPTVQDKQVLVGGDAAMKPALMKIPPRDPARDRGVLKTVAVLASDGSVSGSNRMEMFGSPDPLLRAVFAAIPADQLPRLGQQLLGAGGQAGEGQFTMSDMRDVAQPVWIAVDFKLPMRVNVPGPGALPQAFGINMVSANAFVTSILRQERKLPFACPGAEGIEEQLELRLPPEVKITTLPEASSIESPYGRYSASYELKDQVLRIVRKMEGRQPRTVCTEADGVELRKFATAINQELRKQVLYQ